MDNLPELEQTGEKLGIISGILSKSSLILYTLQSLMEKNKQVEYSIEPLKHQDCK